MDVPRVNFKKDQQRKQGLMIAGGVLAAIVVSVLLFNLKPAAPQVERGAVWIDTVKRGELLRQVRGPGTLVPKEIRWIAAESDGRVERVLVKPGAVVKADSVILELYNPDVVRAFDDARAGYAGAKADHAAVKVRAENEELDQRARHAEARANYESAKLQVEAEKELVDKGVVSQITFKRSVLTADQLKIKLDIEAERLGKAKGSVDAQMNASAAKLEQARTTFTLREQQFRGLKVRAGIDGVLQQLPVEEGQQVQQGMNLARVAQPDVLIAELRVPETQARDIALGQPVSVDTRNGIVPGTVLRIDPAVANGTVQVDVELTGELPRGARPDLSVDGTIEIERLPDVLFVGRPAYGQPESTVTLFKLQADGSEAIRVPVELGRSSVNLIEIRKGLVEGDQVVLSDTAQWDDYDRIDIQ
jgi:HlyD family secretion protein